MKNVSTFTHRLRVNSQETELCDAILTIHELGIDKVLINDGPWIDIEIDEASRPEERKYSVRKHPRAHDILEKNLQIRFEFEINQLRILMGDLFGHKSNGQPLAREHLSIVWDSNTGLDGNLVLVCQEIRDALAWQLQQILIELRIQIIRQSEEKHLDLNPREMSQEALSILSLRKSAPRNEQPDLSDSVLEYK